MLKKIIFYTLLVFVIFDTHDVLAFYKEYKYNYEVKELKKDANGNITINGWAIPNAGVNDGSNGNFSPNQDKYLGSGSSKYCTTNAPDSYYTYTLIAVPVDSSNKPQEAKGKVVGGPIKGIKGLDEDTGKANDDNTDSTITRILCHKDNNYKCVSSRSSCYENVNFNFTFNEKDLVGEDFKNGYVLYLKLAPSASKQTFSFPLVVYSSRVDGFGNEYRYVDNSGKDTEMKVTIVVTKGYEQSCDVKTNECSRPEKNANHFPNLATYSVYGILKSAATSQYPNQTFYHLDATKNIWAPAAFVAPPSGIFGIMPPPDTPKEVKSCSENKSGQSPDTKSVASCNGNVKFSGSNYEDCMVDNYKYYTKKCFENNYNVSFSINDINDASKSFLKTSGAGFTASANLSTKYECSYTFDVSKFETDYKNALSNLSYYKEGSEEWYANQNILINLRDILERYQEQTKNINKWNSGYNLSKVKANLNVTYNSSKKDTVSLVYDDNNVEHLDMDGKKVTDTSNNNFCKVNQSRTLNISGLKNRTVSTDVYCQESYKVKLELPEVCLSMQTGNAESCNTENNQLTGGRKYYIDMSETGGKVELVIDKLGYDGNWKAVLNGCSFTSPSLKLKYRPIDLHDPFLLNYDKERYKQALNYYNSVYNFINIIHDDIWEDENNYMYQYTMSKTNIKNIRKDTKEDEAGSYLGRDCSFVNNKYICKFTRNLTDDLSDNQKVWFEDANFK